MITRFKIIDVLGYPLKIFNEIATPNMKPKKNFLYSLQLVSFRRIKNDKQKRRGCIAIGIIPNDLFRALKYKSLVVITAIIIPKFRLISSFPKR